MHLVSIIVMIAGGAGFLLRFAGISLGGTLNDVPAMVWGAMFVVGGFIAMVTRRTAD